MNIIKKRRPTNRWKIVLPTSYYKKRYYILNILYTQIQIYTNTQCLLIISKLHLEM